MGTNVYARIHPPVNAVKKTALRIKDALYQDLNPDPYSEAHGILKELEEEYPVLHIGKQSAGWNFLFAPNPKYYDETRESINNFLNRSDVSIWNEYGEEILPFEFWENYGNLKGYTLESYIKANGEILPCPTSYYEHITEEGLRFSNNTDFS